MNDLPKKQMTAQEMGRKAAEINKAKGPGYFSNLASKRWAKSVKCSKCHKRVDKSGFAMHYVGHYTGGRQGDNKSE